MDKVLLGIYCGSLFLLVFVVAPVLLRTKENKNLAGGFYGRMLWRFYPLAFFLLLMYLITTDEKLYALLLMLLLGFQVMLSKRLKNYKKVLGDIDKVPYEDPKRVLFRKVSLLSTSLLFISFLSSLFLLLNS